jgi:hypothetical protein
VNLIPIAPSIGDQFVYVLQVYANDHIHYVRSVLKNYVALDPRKRTAKLFACPEIAERYRLFCVGTLRESIVAVHVEKLSITDPEIADRVTVAKNTVVRGSGTHLKPDESIARLSKSLRQKFL